MRLIDEQYTARAHFDAPIWVAYPPERNRQSRRLWTQVEVWKGPEREY